MSAPKKSPESQISRAAAANGFSPKATEAMVKWRAGGAASNAWLEVYAKANGVAAVVERGMAK